MRLVIKVGTNVLADSEGRIQESMIQQIVSEIAELHKQHQIILVSSGAIGSGKAKLSGLDIASKKQVWAAVGQPVLMQTYSRHFEAFGLLVGQCLLLRDDFTDRDRYNNSVRTIEGLLAAGVIPIINENDVVAMEDLTVGDNDLLAAMLAVAIKAEKLILLTNQRGIFTTDPEKKEEAELIKTVNDVDYELEKMCSGKTSALGRGGMLSKVKAAKQAVHAGIPTYIADGREEKIIFRILKGDQIGTFFVPKKPENINEQKRWLISSKGFGEIIIDDGAAAALRRGKSLLLPGVVIVKGLFDAGETVEVISKKGQPIAYGKVNYDYKTIQKAQSGSTQMDKEIMHRDYMVILS